MEQKEYISDISSNHISYKIDKNNKKIYMDQIYYEPINIKLFLLELSNSLRDMEKYENFQFVQAVPTHDWDNFLEQNKLWTIVSRDKDYIVIECKICDAFQNIIKGLGIYENHTDYKTIFENM